MKIATYLFDTLHTLREHHVKALLLLALSSSCAAPVYGDRYEVFAPPTLSTEDIATAHLAAKAWENALPGLVMRVRDLACPPTPSAGDICLDPSTTAQIDAKVPGALAATIRMPDDTATIFLNASSTGLVTLTHELGHAMGLQHTETGTVMCKDSACAASAPTCGDVGQWFALRGEVGGCTYEE